MASIPARVRVEGRQRPSRIPVFNGQVKMPRRATSMVRHERKEPKRPQWRAPGSVPVDSTSRHRDSLPPSTVFAKVTDPAKMRRQLLSRPKPRSGVEVFREVVLNLCWEEYPNATGAETALDIGEAMHGISNAIRRPQSSKRLSKAQLEANFDHFANEFWNCLHAPVCDPISRYTYEEGAPLPRNQNGLHRFKYEIGYPFGLDEDTKDEVFVHFGYSQGLSPAALATLGPEWVVDALTGWVSVAEDAEYDGADVEEEGGDGIVAGSVARDSSRLTDSSEEDGVFSGRSMSSESAYSDVPVVIYPSIFEDEPEPEPTSVLSLWRVFSGEAQKEVVRPGKDDDDSGKASPLPSVPVVEEAAAGVDRSQVREPESIERPVVESPLERMTRIKDAIRRMKERQGA